MRDHCKHNPRLSNRPAMLVVEAADLKAVTPENLLCKYVHHTYIIIPASNFHTRTIEFEHIDSLSKLSCELA